MTMAEGDVLLSKDPEASESCTAEVPTVKDLEQLLNTGQSSCNHTDEVWPNLFLGDLVTAHNRFGLWKMGITHVLNAAHGTMFCQGGQDFYGTTIDYYGVPAYDLPDFDISQYFFSAAEFIHKALNTPGVLDFITSPDNEFHRLAVQCVTKFFLLFVLNLLPVNVIG
ncbi:dual specificity protein phosphatase 13A-like isoform X2 [Emydura macquarii macquarii]|uniref:dual specificity protein phosphatase 13A-like isoform X2 n=1 Tax=Emydura macquarii macquarii TaxID=1129001 RepID=UPI00352B2757